MEAAVRNILVNNTSVSALIANIFPETIPQGALFPAMFYSLLNSNPTRCKEGNSGLYTDTLRITIYADRYNDIKAIKQAVINALDDHPGGLIEGVWIDGISFDDERGGYDSEAKAYQRIIDFEVLIKQ